MAYTYHLPAVVIYDQKLQGELRNVPKSFYDREPNPELPNVVDPDDIDEDSLTGGRFRRYAYEDEDTPKGVSSRSLPGQKGARFLASGNEHHPTGQLSEDPYNRVQQVDRRIDKLDAIREELNSREKSHQTYFGPDEATYGILTWGSQQGTVGEAVKQLNEQGTSVKALSVGDMMPFPTEEVTEFLESVDECLVVEMNASAQFRNFVQKELGAYGEKMDSLLKYNGNPFEPHEIVEGLEASIDGGGLDSQTTTFVSATGD